MVSIYNNIQKANAVTIRTICNIDQADLKFFLNHELIKEKTLILEVPGENKEGPDAENIERLKKLVGEA